MQYKGVGVRVVLDGSVCFDPFGACFDYYTQLTPRLLSRGCEVTLTPSPTGVLRVLENTGAEVTHSVAPAANWMPQGAVRQWLSRRKKQLDRWRLRKYVAAGPQTLYQSFYYGLAPHPSLLSVGMILDLIPEKFPHWFAESDHSKFLQRRADYIRRSHHFIAISQTTRQDLIDLFGVDPNCVDVVHLAVEAEAFQRPVDEEAVLSEFASKGLRAPYLLQVGGRANHKNFDRVLEAFARISKQDSVDLVCAGEAWDPKETQKIQDLGLSRRVHLMHRPSKADLVSLYRMAEGLVYPSLYEGFGLPPLEAMAAGCPVAASQGGSIPEVVGEAALAFDPYNVASIQRAMEKLLDPFEADGLRQRGLERVKLFHWDRVAEQTLQVYQRAVRRLTEAEETFPDPAGFPTHASLEV